MPVLEGDKATPTGDHTHIARAGAERRRCGRKYSLRVAVVFIMSVVINNSEPLSFVHVRRRAIVTSNTRRARPGNVRRLHSSINHNVSGRQWLINFISLCTRCLITAQPVTGLTGKYHSGGHLVEDRTKTTAHNYNAQHLRFYRRAGLRRWSLRFNGDEDVDAVPLSSCHFSSICL